MTHEETARERALAFLINEHLLSREEALEALAVAESVIGEVLSRLFAAVAVDDRKACLEAAHALKGSLLNLGLAEPAAVAQDLVQASRAGDASSRRELAGRLEQALSSFSPE